MKIRVRLKNRKQKLSVSNKTKVGKIIKVKKDIEEIKTPDRRISA